MSRLSGSRFSGVALFEKWENMGGEPEHITVRSRMCAPTRTSSLSHAHLSSEGNMHSSLYANTNIHISPYINRVCYPLPLSLTHTLGWWWSFMLYRCSVMRVTMNNGRLSRSRETVARGRELMMWRWHPSRSTRYRCRLFPDVKSGIFRTEEETDFFFLEADRVTL